ncbi:MAG: hypothetical protein JNL10_18665 [Verrucomicrobiales bacterium]|nr:hypothetical protein [Verrucomicrobiales bacterium]
MTAEIAVVFPPRRRHGDGVHRLPEIVRRGAILGAMALGFGLLRPSSMGAERTQAASTNTVAATSILKDRDLRRYEGVRSATLLTWMSREDDRPWFVDDALLLLEMPRGRWVLVHAVRNPRFPPGHRGGSTEWGLHHVMDAPPAGDRRFDHLPTSGEMHRFLRDTAWPAPSDVSWRVLRRTVDTAAWKAALGYPPPDLVAPRNPGGPATEGK